MRALIALATAVCCAALTVAPASAAAAGPGTCSVPCPASSAVTTPAPTPTAAVPQLEPTPAPATSTATSGGGGGGILGRILGGLDPISWINGVVSAAVRPVFEAWGAVVFQTPDLIDNTSVRDMWLVLLAISDACLVLMVLYRAHKVTWGNLVAQTNAKHGLERIFVGAAGAHLNLLILAPLAAIANALTAVLLQVGGANLQVRVEMLIPIVVQGVSGTNPLMTLFTVAIVITAILVVFWSLVRWIVFALVTALGAPANYALALDQEQLTRAWWRCEVILLFVPVLQVVCYDLSIWLFFGINTILPNSSALISAMGVLVLMWCLYHVPKVALRSAAAPLMAAADAAKGKVKLALGLAALGVGAATGISLGVGARGLSAHGLMRSLVGRAGRRRAAERRSRQQRRRRRQRGIGGQEPREPPLHVDSERVS
jgi:hypothetical protein